MDAVARVHRRSREEIQDEKRSNGEEKWEGESERKCRKCRN